MWLTTQSAACKRFKKLDALARLPLRFTIIIVLFWAIVCNFQCGMRRSWRFLCVHPQNYCFVHQRTETTLVFPTDEVSRIERIAL